MSDSSRIKKRIYSDLVESFAGYLFQFDNPSIPVSKSAIIEKYQNDAVFNIKVRHLASAAMLILDDHVTDLEHSE